MPVRQLSCLVVLPFAICLTAASKTSEKISCEDLPAAVRAAAAGQNRKAGTPASCEKISDKQEIFYEVKVTADSGKMREIVFRPDGRIVESEDEGQLSDIPPAARKAIVSGSVKGKLHKVDIIHRGEVVLYEGEYIQDGKKSKLIVNSDGKVVD